MSGRSSRTWSIRSSGADEVASRPRRVGGPAHADHQVAAHAGGEVDQHVDVALADPLDDLAVERDVAARRAGLGVADVAVHDRRAGARRLDRGVGDLRRRDRQVRMDVLRWRRRR